MCAQWFLYSFNLECFFFPKFFFTSNAYTNYITYNEFLARDLLSPFVHSKFLWEESLVFASPTKNLCAGASISCRFALLQLETYMTLYSPCPWLRLRQQAESYERKISCPWKSCDFRVVWFFFSFPNLYSIDWIVKSNSISDEKLFLAKRYGWSVPFLNSNEMLTHLLSMPWTLKK